MKIIKIIAAYLAGVLTALGFIAGAAVTTITTTAPEDARIVVAFGDYLHVGRNATQGEVAGAVRAWVASVVANYETEQARRSISITPIAPS